MINRFRDENFFLSNFYECPVTFEGLTYGSSEAAFQAQKTLSEKLRHRFTGLDPSEAKKLGQRIELRYDWERVKKNVMLEICRAKFEQNPDLAEKLLATGNEELVEGNDWGDTIWGICNGKGENYLGRILMRIRLELRGFDVEKVTNGLVDWIRDYFAENGDAHTMAVIGISGGKDSLICTKLCIMALGGRRVFGILMPQGEQPDIDFSRRITELFSFDTAEINIGESCKDLLDRLSVWVKINRRAEINTPARIRMAVLYAAAACLGGRVVNTCNLSEDWVGYATKFGDGAGDFSILSNLTVTEVRAIGDYLDLPYSLVHKVPTDGLCGKTDEENLGFTYEKLDEYIRGLDDLSSEPELKEKIDRMHRASRHKLEPMPAANVYNQ